MTAQVKTVRVWGDTVGAPTTCRSCDAPIVFARTVASNKAMPFDGTELVALRTERDEGSGRAIWHVDQASNHFANCPQGPAWSRR